MKELKIKTPETAHPWEKSSAEVMNSLGTSEKGLSLAEAKKRLAAFGPNDLSEKGQRHAIGIFISQFTSPLVLILIGAAGISYFVGESVDASVILAIVFLSSLMGFFQEYRAERCIRALKKFITARARVIRNGDIVEINAQELVPGDVIHLNIGDIIPADIRLFHVDDFTTDESSLTGESAPVQKNSDPLASGKSLPQNLTNMVFMGTSVSSGLGEGVIIATGEQTFFGKTASFLKQKNPDTGFHKGIKEFGHFLLKITFAMTLFILLANAVLGKPFLDSLLFAIAIAVGITPEVLPILITITLSNGALKMAKKKVITKTLASVEDFGNMDTLCCDKTGTLTEGQLALADYRNFDGEENEQLLLYGLLCNSATVGKGKRSFGNVVDKALWESEKAAPLTQELKEYKTADRNEFDFERRRMSVVVKNNEGRWFIAKGAPESILHVCTSVRIHGKDETLTHEMLEKINKKMAEYEDGGYRIIAVAEKIYSNDDSSKDDEHDLTFLGVLLFLDPPKKSVKESLVMLQKLGVTIKIISGDSPGVTRKICEEVGLNIVEKRVVTGSELEKLHTKEFEKYSHTYNVFARVSPEQKYRIVQTLNRDDHVVGFLGDGINDAPALKAADVGISVDSASGIAKEAADILLLKKSLRVLADGIIEGRKIFGNITKYILNTISANFGNMITVASSSVFLPFIPLLPSQILLNNLVSDAPLLTIASDNVDEDLIKKPKKWQIKLIFKFMIYFGIISTVFDLALIVPMIFFLHTGQDVFRTAWFVESALSEIIITFAIRSRLPFFKSKPSGLLLWTSIGAAFLTVAITYVAIVQKWFGFATMPTSILLFVIGIIVAYFVTAEIAKRYFFKKFAL